MTSQYEISQEFKEMDYQHSDINRFVNSPVVCLAVLRKPQSFKPLSPLPAGNAQERKKSGTYFPARELHKLMLPNNRRDQLQNIFVCFYLRRRLTIGGYFKDTSC